jgi:hypothetical protein
VWVIAIRWIAPGGLYAWNRMMKTTTHDENLFNAPEKGGSMSRLTGGHRSMRLDTCFRGFRVAVISVRAEENKDQAWRRHIKKDPEDRNADIKIFSYARQRIP